MRANQEKIRKGSFNAQKKAVCMYESLKAKNENNLYPDFILGFCTPVGTDLETEIHGSTN